MNPSTSHSLITFGVVFAALFMGSCNDRSEADLTASAQTEPYRVTTDDVTLSVDKSSIAKLSLVPVSPWKVNESYPTSLALKVSQPGSAIATSQTTYRGKDIAQAASGATVDVPMRGVKPGQENLEGTIKFSLCRADQCIIREAAVSWQVRVIDSTR